MTRQGSSIRCIMGEYLNKRFYKNLPVLPYIVRPYKYIGDFRSQLNINEKSIVFGRHGGRETFDIPFVKTAIKNIVLKKKDLYFLFLNTEKFINHPQVIFLEGGGDIKVTIHLKHVMP